MNNHQLTLTKTFAKKLCLNSLAVLAVGAAGVARAAPVSLLQLDGQRALSVNRTENMQPYVTLPAASADVTNMGSIDGQLSVKTMSNQQVSISLNHARNEAGTLFVYLNVDTSNGTSMHRKLPLTITNRLTGKSVTLNVQVNALAARRR